MKSVVELAVSAASSADSNANQAKVGVLVRALNLPLIPKLTKRVGLQINPKTSDLSLFQTPHYFRPLTISDPSLLQTSHYFRPLATSDHSLFINTHFLRQTLISTSHYLR